MEIRDTFRMCVYFTKSPISRGSAFGAVGVFIYKKKYLSLTI